VDITGRCNSRCYYCSHFESENDVDVDLPIEEWIDFFKELNKLTVLYVTLQGGEPFFRGDIYQIIEGIKQNRMRFTILSNGTLIDNNIAKFLKSNGRCNGVQISIDGSTAAVHESFRSKDTFDKAITGIENLLKYSIPVGIRVTIHKKNIFDLENIANLLLNKIGLPGFSTNSVSYMGLCRQNPKELQLTVEERTKVMEVLLKLNKHYKGRIKATSGPLAEAKRWIMMEKARLEKKDKFPNCGYLTACGCIFNSMAVRADGVMIPCNLLSHIKLGRINRDSLKETWQDHPELRKLRERRSIPLNEFEFCRSCEYVNYCTGNCPASAFSLLNEVYHPDPDACLKRFLDSGGKLPHESLLRYDE